MSVQGSKYGQHATAWYTAKNMDELADLFKTRAEQAEKTAKIATSHMAPRHTEAWYGGEAAAFYEVEKIIRACKVES